MKPEAQRIAIAEVLGFKNINYFDWEGFIEEIEVRIPDYLADLNAMHEAEKILSNDQIERYRTDLWNIVAPGEIFAACAPLRCLRAFIGATADERAEAFLRTINKWDDSK